jgi:hypothetical protein
MGRLGLGGLFGPPRSLPKNENPKLGQVVIQLIIKRVLYDDTWFHFVLIKDSARKLITYSRRINNYDAARRWAIHIRRCRLWEDFSWQSWPIVLGDKEKFLNSNNWRNLEDIR